MEDAHSPPISKVRPGATGDAGRDRRVSLVIDYAGARTQPQPATASTM